MSNLSVIIPLHIFDDTYKTYLEKAIASVIAQDEDYEIAFAGPKEVLTKIKQEIAIPAIPVLYVECKDTSYCAMVNKTVNKITSPFFTVLEADDTFNGNWFKNVGLYAKEKTGVSMFMPLIHQLDAEIEESKNFVGFMNEIAWAQGFAETPGYIGHEELMNYCDFCASGSIIKRDDFLSVGGLKKTIKLFFWYEFMLRLENAGKKEYVIPRVGYKHLVNRKGSMISEYAASMTPEEGEFWLKTAQSEYQNKDEKEIVYTPTVKE